LDDKNFNFFLAKNFLNDPSAYNDILEVTAKVKEKVKPKPKILTSKKPSRFYNLTCGVCTEDFSKVSCVDSERKTKIESNGESTTHLRR